MSKEKPGILANLALKYGSDKWGHHYYCNHYERHLQHLKNMPITLIELGVGGYQFPDRGGAGLRMWADFFTHSDATVIGVDIHEKKLKLPEKVSFFQASQDDENLIALLKFVKPEVIDDASHMNNLTINSFKLWFPQLAPGGIYIIEDIESSWWEEHGFDGCRDISNLSADTTANFCRLLLNEVNKKTTGSDLYPIESMHFYENMVIIHKK